MTVTNDADIIADAGEGIRVFNYGTANETVTDEPNTTITALGQPILGQTIRLTVTASTCSATVSATCR